MNCGVLTIAAGHRDYVCPPSVPQYPQVGLPCNWLLWNTNRCSTGWLTAPQSWFRTAEINAVTWSYISRRSGMRLRIFSTP